MKLCVIDLGTNSIHSSLVEIEATGSFRILFKDKEMIRLGDDTLISHELSEDALQIASKAVKRFVETCSKRGCDHFLAVATSAVRESSNGGVLVDRIYQETGLKVQVITGDEEARLIDQAVIHTVDLDPNSLTVVIDIGGGSTELILKEGKKTLQRQSIKMGSNRLRQLVTLSDPPEKKELHVLDTFLATNLAQLIQIPQNCGVKTVLGTSGTMNALARMLTHDLGQQFKSQKKVGKEFTLKQIKDFFQKIKKMNFKERQAIKGLDEKRIDMIVHGVAYILQLMYFFDAEFLQTSEQALREGLVYDYIQKHQKEIHNETLSTSVRERSVLSLFHRWETKPKHAEQVKKLALKLFDELQDLHQLTVEDRELLGFAALLHDIGYAIHYNKHHKHGAYLIRNSDLQGFSGEEVEIISSMVRFHRRSYSKDEKHFSQLSNQCKIKVLKLAALLRLADSLDHSHFELITDLELVSENDQELVMGLHSNQDIQWDVYEAEKRSDLFEEIFKKRLVLQHLKG